ncbi:MAG TPA: ATP-binding protein [Edaphobacter sp.]|nr:ATP-binding protein [Edaphobacter sp.]
MSGTATLTASSAPDFDACTHTVQFYEDDSFLLDSLTKLIGTALVAGDAAVVIATAAHRDELAQRLISRGLNVETAAEQGRYCALDAAETLSAFMVNGSPDAAQFTSLISSVITSAQAAAENDSSRLVLFGEMVALLWTEGKSQAAIRLEQLWNDLTHLYSFNLHCAYSIRDFDREGHNQAFLSICAEHSHVVPTENYTALLTEDDRLRHVSLLQQQAHTVETETADRKEAQRLLQAFFDHGCSLAFIMKPDGQLLDVNSSAIKLSGLRREQIIGRCVWDCSWWNSLPEEQQNLRNAVRAAAAGDEVRDDCSYLDAQGEKRFADRSITPIRNDKGEVTLIVGSCNDTTDRLRAEEALRKSEKLAATGRLAASIAHEINNPLEAITNAIYLARTLSGDSADITAYLKMADEELARVAQITRQTLGFYRETSSPMVIKISTLLDDLLSLYSRKLQAKRLSVQKQYRDEIEIWGLKGELRQVFANQIANAIYFMPEGGCLTIRIRKSKSWSNGQCPGTAVSVIDTGSGIAPELQSRIFDPFYTTKQDIGIGLGLWITNNIVLRHGGSIRVRSSSHLNASGTIFTTFLPQHGLQS